MPKTFQRLTRPAMRKLAAGQKMSEHGITFERTANGDGVFSQDGNHIHAAMDRLENRYHFVDTITPELHRERQSDAGRTT